MVNRSEKRSLTPTDRAGTGARRTNSLCVSVQRCHRRDEPQNGRSDPTRQTCQGVYANGAIVYSFSRRTMAPYDLLLVTTTIEPIRRRTVCERVVCLNRLNARVGQTQWSHGMKQKVVQPGGAAPRPILIASFASGKGTHTHTPRVQWQQATDTKREARVGARLSTWEWKGVRSSGNRYCGASRLFLIYSRRRQTYRPILLE